MNKAIEALIRNMHDVFHDKPWYGNSMTSLLNKVDIEKVNVKPEGFSKSIATLVEHMINWRLFVLEKLKGNAEYIITTGESQDWTDIHIENLDQWNLLLQKLKKTQKDLEAQLLLNNDDILNQKVPGSIYNFDYLIVGIIQHDIYHLGQITVLNSLTK